MKVAQPVPMSRDELEFKLATYSGLEAYSGRLHDLDWPTHLADEAVHSIRTALPQIGEIIFGGLAAGGKGIVGVAPERESGKPPVISVGHDDKDWLVGLFDGSTMKLPRTKK